MAIKKFKQEADLEIALIRNLKDKTIKERQNWIGKKVSPVSWRIISATSWLIIIVTKTIRKNCCEIVNLKSPKIGWCSKNIRVRLSI